MWLSGVLAYFLYNYGSMAIGAAYNSLFLIYVALFSASLFGLVLVYLICCAGPSRPLFQGRELPGRGIGSFLLVDGCPFPYIL